MSKVSKKTTSTKMKFKKAPGAPKRFKSAFLFFSEYKHKEIRQQAKDKKIRAAQAAKVVSQAWKELSDADRAQFLEMGRRDRERYEREKAAYKGPWKIPDIKDPNAPKKPMSAFLAFGNERRGLIAEANPTLSNTEISSLLSKLWKECPANMKQAYRDREARERAEFKKNFAEWQRKHDEVLVLDHHSNSSSNGSDSVADDGSNSSHGTTSVTTSHHQQQESTPAQPVSQERAGNVQQSSGSIEEEIPVDIFMPNAVVYPQPKAAAPLPMMVSDEAIIMEDEFIMPDDEAWPFNRVVPKMIALPPAASASRFANYSMDDILQDDELFFDDFSPLQVVSVTQQQHQQHS